MWCLYFWQYNKCVRGMKCVSVDQHQKCEESLLRKCIRKSEKRENTQVILELLYNFSLNWHNVIICIYRVRDALIQCFHSTQLYELLKARKLKRAKYIKATVRMRIEILACQPQSRQVRKTSDIIIYTVIPQFRLWCVLALYIVFCGKQPDTSFRSMQMVLCIPVNIEVWK